MANLYQQMAARLKADNDFINHIGFYKGEPCIVVGMVMPQELSSGGYWPVVLIEDAPMSDQDTGLDLRRQSFRIRIYGIDSAITDQISNRIKRLLNRWSATTDSGAVITSTASGAMNAPTDDPNLTGRYVIISLYIQE